MHLKTMPLVVGLMLTLATMGAAASSPTEKNPRTSTSIIKGEVIESQYPPIPDKVTGPRDYPSHNISTNKTRTILHHNHGLWIYDLLINLNIDSDLDGHFSSFTITLDIENSFTARDVYAVFYLSQNQGPWFEYAATSAFTVNGNSANDSISIETSLETGYPADYYDLYAEIYDAYSGELLLTYGPDQSGHVIGIPFESEYDDWHHHTPGSAVSVQLSFSGAGSISWLTLFFFVSLAAYRKYLSNNRFRGSLNNQVSPEQRTKDATRNTITTN